MVIFREAAGEAKGWFAASVGETGGREGERQVYRLGVGLDLGTTTLAAYLWDFRQSKLVCSLSEENCQTRWGADVMMRIMHAQRGNAGKLHQMIVEQAERMTEELLRGWEEQEKTSVADREIALSVVGNPTMCHFFLDQDVTGLAGAPFRSAYTGNYLCLGRDVGFRRRGGMSIVVLSGIAAHVGGDALAMWGAVRRPGGGETTLMVDLGTNAEMILTAQGKCHCCSTAAGPALEGRGISCGVRADAGAITGVRLAPGTGNIVLEYLPGREPQGVAGTGLLELLAGLCRCGLLTPEGYLLEQREAGEKGIHPELAKRLVTVEGERGFLLCGQDKKIILRQSDVRTVQLAKGAILAGIRCILREGGVSPEEVENVVVAGALGAHLREEVVFLLGLFPAAFRGKLSFVGNAAGAGAVKMLAEPDFAREMEERAREMLHIELAESKEFQRCLMEGMALREA